MGNLWGMYPLPAGVGINLIYEIYPCEITLRIPRIFLRIPRKKFLGIPRNSQEFLGMKGVIFHGKLELRIPRNSQEFQGIPRLKNNDCECPGILRNSKLKENQTEISKTFQEIPDNFLESLGIFCEI